MNKKIYFIRANSTKFGGAENYLYRLTRALSKNNYKFQIIHSFIPNFLPSWLRVILFNIQVSIFKGKKFYFSLDRIICPDIYRAGDGVHKVFLTLEKKSALNILHPIYLYLEKKCFNNAKYIIANSKMVKQQIIDTYKINSKKIKVIYTGIELKDSSYDKSFIKLSKEFSIKSNESIILFVGSGFKRKGVEELLNILSHLKNKNFKAFIIGKEKKINRYLKLSKNLKINDKVVFTGPRLDVDDFYAISDIFIFPTHYDPFSNVILEAMNFGTVVFTTINNGASEILDKDFIIKNQNDLKVISLIDTLLIDKKYLDSEKIKNKKISKKYSIENNLMQTLKLIDKNE